MNGGNAHLPAGLMAWRPAPGVLYEATTWADIEAFLLESVPDKDEHIQVEDLLAVEVVSSPRAANGAAENFANSLVSRRFAAWSMSEAEPGLYSSHTQDKMY